MVLSDFTLNFSFLKVKRYSKRNKGLSIFNSIAQLYDDHTRTKGCIVSKYTETDYEVAFYNGNDEIISLIFRTNLLRIL